MASLLNNYVFQLTGTLLTSWTSVTISNDLELWATVAFTDARIVLRNRNATIIERWVATAAAGTLTFSKRWLEQWETEVENASLKKEWREGTIVYVTVLASQIVDKQADNTFSGTQTFNNIIVDNQLTIPRFADDTARDAAIPSPVNGMIIYNTADWVNQQYIWGAWSDIDTGSTSNASETVSGKVELATKAEQGSQTETGSQWPLVVQAKNTAKSYYLYTPAFLTGWSNAESDFSVWAAVTDWSFRITVDWVAVNVDAIDFTGDTDMDDVAATIQTALRAATSWEETVVWSTDHFVITSADDRVTSAITVTTTSTGTVGTDISGAGASDWMDCDTGNGTVTNAVATPSLHENLAILLDNAGKIDSDFIDNAAVLADWVEALVDKDTYFLWEDGDAGDSLFVEEMVDDSLVEIDYNVWDVAVNTRQSFSMIWSWVSWNQFDVSIGKVWSPSVNQFFRIETDNIWNPSGTLVDANATWSIAPWWLVDCWDISDATWDTLSTLSSSTPYWYRFTANRKLLLTWFTVSGLVSGATRYRVTTGDWVVLVSWIPAATVTFPPLTIQSWDSVRIEVDDDWGTYTLARDTTPALPTWTNITYVSWSSWLSDNATWWNITSVQTTALTEVETVTTTGSFTIPKWQRVHLVIYQWNYGSETVNSVNYYKIWASKRDSTTRYSRTYDWVSWNNIWAEVQDNGSATFGSSAWATQAQWYRMLANEDIYITEIWVKSNSVWLDYVFIKDDAWTLIKRVTLDWFVARLPIWEYVYIPNWTYFRIEANNDGVWTYTQSNLTSATVSWTNVDYVTWSLNGANNANAKNIDYVKTSTYWWQPLMPYVISDVFEYSLLSKTNAEYAYKLPRDVPRLATETKSEWEVVITTTFWINNNFSGLTPLIDYFISDTPWQISLMPWTISCAIGKAISNSELYLWKYNYYFSPTIWTVYRSWNDGIVFATVIYSSNAPTTLWYADDIDGNTTIVANSFVNYATYANHSISFFVKKWQFYKITTSWTVTYSHTQFYPLNN